MPVIIAEQSVLNYRTVIVAYLLILRDTVIFLKIKIIYFVKNGQALNGTKPFAFFYPAI